MKTLSYFPLCPVCNYAQFAGVPSQGLPHDVPVCGELLISLKNTMHWTK